MKVYFAFSKGYSVALLVFLLVAFCFFSIASSGKSTINLENEGQRVEFISRYGLRVGDPQIVKTVNIPKSFDENFKECSKLLSKGGYRLDAYTGKTVTEYTYNADSGYVVRLVLYGEKLVGAYCFNAEDATMYPLAGEKIGTNKAG